MSGALQGQRHDIQRISVRADPGHEVRGGTFRLALPRSGSVAGDPEADAVTEPLPHDVTAAALEEALGKLSPGRGWPNVTVIRGSDTPHGWRNIPDSGGGFTWLVTFLDAARGAPMVSVLDARLDAPWRGHDATTAAGGSPRGAEQCVDLRMRKPLPRNATEEQRSGLAAAALLLDLEDAPTARVPLLDTDDAEAVAARLRTRWASSPAGGANHTLSVSAPLLAPAARPVDPARRQLCITFGPSWGRVAPLRASLTDAALALGAQASVSVLHRGGRAPASAAAQVEVTRITRAGEGRLVCGEDAARAYAMRQQGHLPSWIRAGLCGATLGASPLPPLAPGAEYRFRVRTLASGRGPGTVATGWSDPSPRVALPAFRAPPRLSAPRLSSLDPTGGAANWRAAFSRAPPAPVTALGAEVQLDSEGAPWVPLPSTVADPTQQHPQVVEEPAGEGSGPCQGATLLLDTSTDHVFATLSCPGLAGSGRRARVRLRAASAAGDGPQGAASEWAEFPVSSSTGTPRPPSGLTVASVAPPAGGRGGTAELTWDDPGTEEAGVGVEQRADAVEAGATLPHGGRWHAATLTAAAPNASSPRPATPAVFAISLVAPAGTAFRLLAPSPPTAGSGAVTASSRPLRADSSADEVAQALGDLASVTAPRHVAAAADQAGSWVVTLEPGPSAVPTGRLEAGGSEEGRVVVTTLQRGVAAQPGPVGGVTVRDLAPGVTWQFRARRRVHVSGALSPWSAPSHAAFVSHPVVGELAAPP